MAKSFKNQLTGQIGEHLACAELGRRGYIATSFSGNVPEFDLLIANENLQTIPIQVKTLTEGNWTTKITDWIDIIIDDNEKKQIDNGNKKIDNPDLIYICIMLKNKSSDKDRFFILTKKDLQTICTKSYRKWMDSKGWKRPNNYKSIDCKYGIEDIRDFENNWGLIEDRIHSS